MRPKTLLVVASLLLALSIKAPTAFADNLVTNGSFETADFTGWSTGGNFEFTQVVTGSFYQYSAAEDGVWYATLGP